MRNLFSMAAMLLAAGVMFTSCAKDAEAPISDGAQPAARVPEDFGRCLQQQRSYLHRN